MSDVPIREVICENCWCHTIQPFSTLEPLLWLQATSSEDGIYINYACPGCYKLTRSLVEAVRTLPDADFSKCPGPGDLTSYIVFLKCTKKGCDTPAIVLAPVQKTFGEEDLMAHIRKHWTNHGAACGKGHPPTYPYEVRIWKHLDSAP